MGAACCRCSRKSVAPLNTSKPVLSTKPLQRIPEEDFSKLRFTNISVTTNDPLKLIKGYEKEPLVSLEEALKPFHGKIDNLLHFIQEAKTKCRHPSKHKLTHDELAAIYIYSMKWSKICVFDHLQHAWKTEQQSELKPWFKYLKLLKTGLNKLPDATGEIWQATSFNEDLKKLLTSDSKPLYVSMGSGLPSEKDLRGHLRNDSARRMIFVSYAFIKGKVVTGYTADQWEEVLVWPGVKLGKAEFKETPDGLLFVHFNRNYKHVSNSILPKISSTKKHFVCPYKNCGNHCPGDHHTDHCLTFSILTHTLDHHHCGSPCTKCEKCGKVFSKLYSCHKCNNSSCAKCCYK